MLTQSVIQSNQPKGDAKPQYCRVTLQDARRRYEAGHITTLGLVYFAIAIKRKAGWKLRMTVEMAWKELGIKKSAFYKAISQLKADGWIQWDAPEGLNVWIPVEGATEALPIPPNSLPILNKPPFPRMRKVFRDRGNVSGIAENQAPKPFQADICGDSPDIYQRSFRSTTTESVAATSEKILEGDLWSEQLPSEEGQDGGVETADDLKHPTEIVEGVREIQKEIGGEPKPTSEDKCSALHLETLRKLGLTLSHGFKAQLEAVDYETVGRAIACFKEDKATWTAGEMKNPPGYFIRVLQQVQAGRQPDQRPELEIDSIYAALELWRKRWKECLLMQRPMLLRDMRIEFSGRIDVLDPDDGPIIVQVKSCA